METKIIEIKIKLDDSLKSLLKLKLKSVDYKDLESLMILISEELKERHNKIGISTGNCTTGNYQERERVKVDTNVIIEKSSNTMFNFNWLKGVFK